MTVSNWPAPGAAAAPAVRPATLSPRERHNYRARVWRFALGALGLFWVCVMLLLAS